MLNVYTKGGEEGKTISCVWREKARREREKSNAVNERTCNRSKRLKKRRKIQNRREKYNKKNQRREERERKIIEERKEENKK